MSELCTAQVLQAVCEVLEVIRKVINEYSTNQPTNHMGIQPTYQPQGHSTNRLGPACVAFDAFQPRPNDKHCCKVTRPAIIRTRRWCSVFLGTAWRTVCFQVLYCIAQIFLRTYPQYLVAFECGDVSAISRFLR